jgi:hypothetical protein
MKCVGELPTQKFKQKLFFSIEYVDQIMVFWVLTPCIYEDTDILEKHPAYPFKRWIV